MMRASETVDPGRSGAPGLRSPSLVALAVFVLAFFARLTNVSSAYRDGAAVFPPFDDAYHLKRISYSAAHPGHVLEWDPDRGAGGAFCPWPPLYDGLAGPILGGLARMTKTPLPDVATWMPPAAGAGAAALLAGALAAVLSPAAGLVAGGVLAFSEPQLATSRLGSLDHHFLEPALLAGLLAAVAFALRARSGQDRVRAGLLLGTALAVALFVQTALLFGAALAAAALLLISPSSDARRAGAAGFGGAAALVAAWRIGRPPGYPDDEWFLGWPHATALLAAAVALVALDQLRTRTRLGVPAAVALAGGAGVLVLAAVPNALPAFLAGSRFFGGDPWLSTIAEFQPLFTNPWSSPLRDAMRLGGAPLLAAGLLVAGVRGRAPIAIAVGIFGAAYGIAACASTRFLVPAAGPLAIAAAFSVHRLLARSRGAAAAAAALAILPGLPLLYEAVRHPDPVIPASKEAPIRAAHALRGVPGPGRVLSSWSLGHLYQLWSGRPVLVDGFGAAQGRAPFDNALAVLLSTDEAVVARFCDATGARFVALDNPLAVLPVYAATVGADPGRYLRPGPNPDSPPGVTRLAQATFWWRAYFEEGRPMPGRGRAGVGFTRFRVVYRDAERAGRPPFVGPAALVLERVR